jgi:hypothetical protein
LDMSNTRTAKFRQKMARVRELQQIWQSPSRQSWSQPRPKGTSQLPLVFHPLFHLQVW